MGAKAIVLKSYADEGLPTEDHFEIMELEIPPLLIEGSIQIKVLAMSADPYLRGRINSRSPMKYPLGETMSGFVVGKVVASLNNPNWAEGDLFGGSLPFMTVQTLTPKVLQSSLLWKLTGLLEESEITLGLGIMGMPGSTAYGGLIDVLRPNNGETIFISAASGAVGSIVGMLAKRLYNCTVIGSCGGAEKCALIKEKFGFDHAIDYKTLSTAEELIAALKEVAPNGIDMYFENVGGIHFDAAYASLRPHGRIAVCGGISQYNEANPALNAINPMKMVYTFQRIEGFISLPWLSGKKGNFVQDMHRYYREGLVVSQETYFDGIEHWVDGFQSLFTGTNVGKVVVRI
jgi:NADPH-dependent curcumin reductase CurA